MSKKTSNKRAMSTLLLPMASPKSLKRTFDDANLGSLPMDLTTSPQSYRQPAAVPNAEIPTDQRDDTAISVDSSRLSSPAPSQTSSSAGRGVVAQVSQLPSGSAANSKRPKLTFIEKELKRIEKESKDREKAEEKARKEQEKELRDRQKADDKAKKEEERRAKDLEREVKRLVQEEKNKIKEEEKARKEEEKNKKARVRSALIGRWLMFLVDVLPVTAPLECFLRSSYRVQ